MSLRKLAFVLWIGWFALLTSAHAQKYTGTVHGSVSDAQGAVVAGADVTVLNQDTGLSRSLTTNDQGEFTAPELPAGMYRVEVKKAGFKRAVQENVELHVADRVSVRITLQVGAASEQVTVEANAIQVETQTGEVSNVVVGEQVRELPLNGRSFVQLTTLMPGVSTAESFDPKNKGLLSAVDLSISGGSSTTNLWTVDGASNNDVGSQRTILVFPSIDAIEEFKIHRNSYGPEYGQSGGAQINIITRSGKNDFHGDAYYFGRNDALNAFDYFLKQSCASDPNCRKQPLRRNDFGYTFGGPIKKDKIFFFWSQEWNREKRGVVRHALVPTALERQGDFSQTCSTRIPNDPSTGLPMTQVPANLLSPAGQLMLNIYPLPNLTDPCARENWVTAVNLPVTWREENIRGDWSINKSTTFTIHYIQDSWANPAPSFQEGGLWGGDGFPAVDANWDQPGKSLVAKITKTLGTTAVNDFQFSWSGNRIFITPGGTNVALNGQINAAIPTIYPVSDKVYGDKRPHMTLWGYGAASTLWNIAPWDNREDLFTWKDDFSKVYKSHTFKAGFLYGRSAKDEQTGDESGEIWGPPVGVDNNWGGGTGNPFADLLMKNLSWGYDENRNLRKVQIRWRDVEFYAGDTWRFNRRLTLELGLRWSFIRQPYMADDKFASFVPSAFSAALGADPCNGLMFPKGTNPCTALGFLGGASFSNRALIGNSNKLIAPRLGFAWDLFGNGKTVLRSGLGRFFSRDRLTALETGGANPPFSASVAGERLLDAVTDPLNCPGTLTGAACTWDVGGPSYGVPTAGVDPAALIPNTWQWNLTFERELARDTKLELAYVGSRGIHLLSKTNLNEVLPQYRLDAARVQSGADSNLVPYRPYGVFGGSRNIFQVGHRGDSIYHSFQAMFNTRISRRTIVQAAYTWAKQISTLSQGYVDNVDSFSDSSNIRLDRGLSDFHRTHVFSANVVYELPTLQGQNALLKNVAGGWQLGAIMNFTSGRALTVRAGTIPTIQGASGTGYRDNQRPNRVPGVPCHLEGPDKTEWLNPAAFTFNGFQLGKIGNSPRGACFSPPTQNVDFALDKSWRLASAGSRFLREGLKMQFRLEFFNVFNHPQFRDVNTTYQVVSADGTNNIFVDANGVVSSDPSTAVSLTNLAPDPDNRFGRSARMSGAGSREIQYGIKFIF